MKAIELGHVVVNVHTGVAARVRGFSPQFGPFDDEATVLVEIGRLPWGHQEEWLRSAVVLSSDYERQKERERAAGEEAAILSLIEKEKERRERDEAEVEIAGIRTERRRRPDGLIRLVPRLGPWCRVDRRLRTAPHGDALDTSVRPDPLAEPWMAIKVGRLRHLVDDAAIHADGIAARHFTLHPAQRRFMDSPGGILIPRRKSPGAQARRNLWGGTTVSNLSWDPGPRLTPGVLKLAGMMAGPRGGDVAQAMADQIDFEWESRRWAEPPGDAEASSNGMGC